MKRKLIISLFMFIQLLVLSACDKTVVNNPHSLSEYARNFRFGSFAAAVKTLDPAQSYSTDEGVIIGQVYEPPLQYHYLKMPYTLIPLTAKTMPVVRYWDNHGRELPATTPSDKIAYSTYDITIQPGIFYQPHPAFAKDEKGNYRYLSLTEDDLKGISQLKDFKYTGTRELVAEDYVYEIKRLASPVLNSPILNIMSGHIVGMSDYAKQLRKVYDLQKAQGKLFLDLRNYPLSGVQVLDKYTYRITLKGQYNQFSYWLAMAFFAPIPWEADAFYSQPGMNRRNINFIWYPVGTGAYLLADNNPNRQMVLAKNPNFRVEYYPTSGEPGDLAAGYLKNAGKRLPLVDKFIFSLEKEFIPRWNKFLQGYYDQSAISSDNFGEAIALDKEGNPHLSPKLANQGISLQTSIQPAVYYFTFNMLDKTVGGYSEKARKLRLAIGIALNTQEFITIFLNGRGVPAQGPIPPGIFGYSDGIQGMNPHIYTEVNGKLAQKPIAVARQLLAEAGYPNGRDAITGKPLVLRYDTVSISPTDKDQFDWMRKQFNKLGIELLIETTDFNRYQDKLSSGSMQIYPYAWVADYPDPENFLALLYGPNGVVKNGGVNISNYQNPAFDQLFSQMKSLPNGPERLAVIEQMQDIVRKDGVWFGSINTVDFLLSQQWLNPMKPNALAKNLLKYQSILPELRIKSIIAQNQPIFWPLLLLIILIIGLIIPVWLVYWRQLHKPFKKYRFEDH